MICVSLAMVESKDGDVHGGGRGRGAWREIELRGVSGRHIVNTLYGSAALGCPTKHFPLGGGSDIPSFDSRGK